MSQLTSQIIPAHQAQMHGLVTHLKDRLKEGASFNNPRLTEAAQKHLGGGRSGGHYTPKDAYDAMELAVNLLLLEGRAAELLAIPFDDALAQLRRLMGQMATQTDRTDEMNEFQQFSTPPPFGFFAARLLAAQIGDVTIEPEAGTGNLAVWLRALGCTVVTNEFAPRRRELLGLLGFEPFGLDAEMLDDLLDPAIKPTGILMNPPFSSTAGRVTRNDPIYGAKHIEQALRRLEPEGRLVTVSTAALAMGAPKFREWWMRIARLYNVRANYTISGKEYAKFGTTVDTQIIVIDKDGATPGASWPEQIKNIKWGKAETLEAAWKELKHLTAREPRQETITPDEQPADVFAPYVAQRLTGGAAHPAEIVESASMAAVMPPVATYRPHLAPEVISEGRLSLIQLESVVYAGQRHEQRLANGARGGFFVGHSTGLGKGRILAAIIADNYNQGRKRALWLSVNNDLMPATQRDLTDIGSGNIALARINDYQADTEIGLAEGVLFSSYSSLISTSKKGAKRLDQIQRWLGKDGVVIADEASKAKNAIGSGRGNDGTQTGQAVIDLQSAEENPDYRIVYSSATGATDVRNMAYMTRLGLWGKGTAFPGGFNEFLNEIESGGVGAMEMVSRDLKSLGMYLSGSISFGVDPVSGKSVEYRELIHRLTDDQREMYDLAAKAWRAILQDIDEAIKATGGGKKQKSSAMMKFWGDHQRFFSQVICAFKIPTIVKEIERALADGKSVVASLVSTGEARTREKVAQAVASGDSLEDLDFTPREVIAGMIERGFPTALYQDVTDPITGRTYQEPVLDDDGNAVHSREAQRMKQELLDSLSALRLPENPLDQIINHFGERAVAELTGRSRRLIRENDTSRVVYKKRAPEGVPMDSVNIYEMEQFQTGRKRIAIISDAASMGISLHASNRAENKQRRVHITLQLGWSADKQMQTFGRTHRSDQAVPPEYVLLSTELGGERRFSSTIARRLGSLGALTKGDRGAADSGDLAKYNFETEEGRASLQYLFRAIMRNEAVPGLDDAKATLRDMGLLQTSQDGLESVKKEDETNVPRFLNRVLALDVDRQNAIFDYFAGVFDRTVLTAKLNGTFDEGVTDIKALCVRFAQQPRVIATDEVTGATTTHYLLDIDRAIKTCPFEEAEAERAMKGGSYRVHAKKGHVVLAIPSRQHTDVDTGKTYKTFTLWRPEGARFEYRKEAELKGKFEFVSVQEAREQWEMVHADLPKMETTRTHIIGGAILPLWQRLKSEQEAKLRVVRVTTETGQRIVGAQIPATLVGPVLRAIGVSRDLKTPAEIFDALLEGDRIQLVTGLYLFRRLLRGNLFIELGGNVRYADYSLIREMGLFSEYQSYQHHFFIPTEPETGVPALTALLKQYPLLKSKEEVERELLERDGEPVMTGVIAEPVVVADINQLIIPVAMVRAKEAKEPEAPKVKQPIEPRRTRSRALLGARPEMVPAAMKAEPVRAVEFNERGQGLLF